MKTAPFARLRVPGHIDEPAGVIEGILPPTQDLSLAKAPSLDLSPSVLNHRETAVQPRRILLYGLNFAPEPTGTGKYTGEMVEWLVRAGHDVRVITTPPYYPDWKIGQGYRAWRYSRETWRGARVYRAPLWVPKSPGGAKRLWHLASFAASSFFPLMALSIAW